MLQMMNYETTTITALAHFQSSNVYMLSNFVLPIDGSVPVKKMVLDSLSVSVFLPQEIVLPLTSAISPFSILAVDVKTALPLLTLLTRTTSNGPRERFLPIGLK